MRVATDIGGTFTDLIYLDEVTGETGMTKASTTVLAENTHPFEKRVRLPDLVVES